MKNNSHTFWHNFVSSPWVFLAGLVLLVFLIRATWNIHKSVDTVNTKSVQTQAELNRLEIQKVDLSAKINALSSDGIESELRTKYRAVKSGESVAVILDDSGTATTPVSSSSSDGSVSSGGGQSWWGRMWGAIGL